MQSLIYSDWKAILNDEFKKKYFNDILLKLNNEREAGYIIYPPFNQIFNALNLTPFSKVRVVIVGQDPYHGIGQANGLAFSVAAHSTVPPSLRSIYKQLLLENCINSIPLYGDLTHWALQGVLLLNHTLTVRADSPASHANYGWQALTDFCLQQLSVHHNHLVFLLWGNHAKSKLHLIDVSKHLVLTAAHPSPLSANRGFFNCNHFTKTNDYLQKNHLKKIIW